MGASVSCSCTPPSHGVSSIGVQWKENGREFNGNCVRNLCSIRQNLVFPNEILEKILSFLSVRDKLIAREVCREWYNHANTAGNLQEAVKVKVCSDELNYLAATSPVFTSFNFHKLDITRQSLSFWELYSDHITHLDFYDCSIIPRNTSNSNHPSFSLGCPNLRYLGLVNCDKYFLMGGTFIQLDEILCLENLETLNLSQNKNLSDSILFSILMKTKKLAKLDLSDCVNMVFMKAVHNRFYPAGKPRPPYSDHVLSFHTLCSDFLQTSLGSAMTCFNFGMKLNSTGMSLLLANNNAKWKCANLESPELKVVDIIEFIQKFHQSLTEIELGRAKLTSDDLFSANLYSLQTLSIYDSRNISELRFLATMPNLQRLVLDGASGFTLNSNCFQYVPNLMTLSLNGIKPKDNPDTCRSELGKIFEILCKLTTLDIGNCANLINDNVVRGIIQHLTKLRHLNLEASCISEIGLVAVRRSPSCEPEAHPKTFEIATNPMDHTNNSASRDQFCLSQLSDLEHLNLSRCRDLNELTWQIPVTLKSLSSLNLSNCNTLSKRGVLSIIDNCRNLERLILMHCSTQVLADQEVVTTAREKLYRCKGIIY